MTVDAVFTTSLGPGSSAVVLRRKEDACFTSPLPTRVIVATPLSSSVAYHCLLYNSDGRIAVDSPYTHDPQKLERAANFWVKVKWRDADEAVKQIKKKRFKMNILRYIKEWLLFYNALDANNIEGLKKSKSKKSKSKKSKSKKSKSKKSKKKPGKKPRNKCKGKRKSECKQDENCRWDMQTRTCVSN